MKNLIRWIVIGALALLMVVLLVLGPSARAVPAIAVFELSRPTLAPPNEQVLPSLTAAPSTGTPGVATAVIPQTGGNPPTPSGGSMVQIRDRVCVRKLPYTILSMPSSAAFEVIQPAAYVARLDPVTRNPNQLVCRSVLTISDTQTVVCTGPQGTFLTLRVTNNAAVEEYSIPLNQCFSTNNNAGPQQNPPQPTEGPSSTPIPGVTDTPAPPDPTETTVPLPTLPIGTP